MLTRQPPRKFLSANEQACTVAHSPEWQQVLNQGLNSQTLYYWDDRLDDGVAVTVFRRAFFHIGFIGFPFGGTVRGMPLTENWLANLRTAECSGFLHALRIVASPFHDQLSLPGKTETVWETEITHLQQWQLNQLSSTVRRNINKAKRSGLVIQHAVSEVDADKIHEHYRATISRHKGRHRYTGTYFQDLIRYSQLNHNLKCFLAISGQDIAGFLIAVRHGTIVYYLHGGINFTYQKQRPSDLLFAHAIEWAKEIGARQFNFMGSPVTQPSLVKFKEKWGGETKQQHTFNLARATTGGALFRIAASIHSAIN